MKVVSKNTENQIENNCGKEGCSVEEHVKRTGYDPRIMDHTHEDSNIQIILQAA